MDRIIAGPTPAVAICSECIALCAQIMREESDPPDLDGPPDPDSPPDPAA